MRVAILFCATTILFAATKNVQSASDWLSAPKPKFPARALQKGSEGSVKLRLVLVGDGSVTKATVLKSSGDSILDEIAQDSVLKWKMKTSAIRPSDLVKGRDEVIEFRQEALMAASYPLGVKAGFANEQQWKPWMYAPFPYYSMDARRLRHTGTAVVSARIGSNGEVIAVQTLKSSGYSDLDGLATAAVRHWRAHKEFAGRNLQVPVSFQLTRR